MASPLQFSMRQLLVAVAFVALGITALLNANGWWMAVLWGLVPLVLSASILLVVYRRDASRAFWSGFAVFGWVYLAIVVLAYWPSGNSPRYDPLAYYQLWTTRLTDWTYQKVIPAPHRDSQIADPNYQPQAGGMSGGMGATGGMPGMGGGGPAPMGGGMPGGAMPGMMSGMGGGFGQFTPMIPNPDYVDPTTFQQIGHALWLLMLAALGGKLALWIYRTQPSSTGSQ